jgi:hypothetical protein
MWSFHSVKPSAMGFTGIMLALWLCQTPALILVKHAAGGFALHFNQNIFFSIGKGRHCFGKKVESRVQIYALNMSNVKCRAK